MIGDSLLSWDFESLARESCGKLPKLLLRLIYVMRGKWFIEARHNFNNISPCGVQKIRSRRFIKTPRDPMSNWNAISSGGPSPAREQIFSQFNLISENSDDAQFEKLLNTIHFSCLFNHNTYIRCLMHESEPWHCRWMKNVRRESPRERKKKCFSTK